LERSNQRYKWQKQLGKWEKTSTFGDTYLLMMTIYWVSSILTCSYYLVEKFGYRGQGCGMKLSLDVYELLDGTYSDSR
jgi:hypothetical protein